MAGLQAALQAVLEKMGTPLVKVHPALLIDQGLQELELGLRELNLCGDRSHARRERPSEIA